MSPPKSKRPAIHAIWVFFLAAIPFACSSETSSASEKASATTSQLQTSHRRGLHNAEAMVQGAKRCEPDYHAVNLPACKRACGLNHSNSCANWGALIANSSEKEALQLYDKACRGGSGIGCEAAARARRARGDTQTKPAFLNARHYHRVHCSQGYARSCAQLASLYADGLGGPANPSLASDFKLRACQLGMGLQCIPAAD